MRTRLMPPLLAALCLLAQVPAHAKSQRKIADCPAGVSVFLSDSGWMGGDVTSFLPYAEVKVCVHFAQDAAATLSDDRRWRVKLSDKSKLNGKELSKEALDYRCNSASSGSEGSTLFLAGESGESVLPDDPGKCNLDLVLDTPAGLWRVPTIKAEVAVPKEDAAAYADFKKLKCETFLTHPHGLRPGKSEDNFYCSFSAGSREFKQYQRALKKNIPYSALVQFVAKHPDSPYVDLLHEKAVRSWERDLWGDGDDHKDVDKKALAQLLAIFEDNPVEACEGKFEDARQDVKDANEQLEKKYRKAKADNIESWVKMLKKAVKDPETMTIREQVKTEREKNPERFKFANSSRNGYVCAPQPRPERTSSATGKEKKQPDSDSLDGLLKD